MAGLIALFLLGLGCVFLLQNREPVLLYFFGNSSQTALFQLTLPLGAWVALFALLGILLGLFLPLCYRLGGPPPKGVAKSSPSPRRLEAPPPPAPERPPVETWDWNPIPEAEDWQEPESDPVPVPKEAKPLEREQAPPQSRQEGSVYRYQYRDKETSPPPEGIYTAPYRVIAPPQTPPTAPESPEKEEEADWI
ncbi:MAG: hypothetical protein ACK5CA_17890 [Cyanobacteriota bacterium]|jgi:hypothetical protein